MLHTSTRVIDKVCYLLLPLHIQKESGYISFLVMMTASGLSGSNPWYMVIPNEEFSEIHELGKFWIPTIVVAKKLALIWS